MTKTITVPTNATALSTFEAGGRMFAVVDITDLDVPPVEKKPARRRKAKSEEKVLLCAPTKSEATPAPTKSEEKAILCAPTKSEEPAAEPKSEEKSSALPAKSEKRFEPLHLCQANAIDGTRFTKKSKRYNRDDLANNVGVVATINKRDNKGTYRAAVLASGTHKNGTKWLYVLSVSEDKGWAFGTEVCKWGWKVTMDRVVYTEVVAFKCKECKSNRS